MGWSARESIVNACFVSVFVFNISVIYTIRNVKGWTFPFTIAVFESRTSVLMERLKVLSVCVVL